MASPALSRTGSHSAIAEKRCLHRSQEQTIFCFSAVTFNQHLFIIHSVLKCAAKALRRLMI